MIWHLVAAVFAGLAAAGIGLILRTLSGKRLPKWIVPVFGGLGMLGYQVSTEYSWFEHKQAQLPDAAEVVASETSSNIWRPWTFAFPITTKFTVIDRDSVHISESPTRVVEFMLYQFERHHIDAVRVQGYLLHCSSRELIPIDTVARELDTHPRRILRQDSGVYNALCTP